MATLTHRPELATEPVGDLSPTGLPGDTRAELNKIEQQMHAIVAPLTQIHSLPMAEEQAVLVAPGYAYLVMQWGQTWLRKFSSLPEVTARSPLFDDIGRSDMVSEDIKEKLYGALESSMGYFGWIHRSYENLDTDEKRRVTEVLEQVGLDVAAAEAALLAVGMVIKGMPGSTPMAIPALAEFVDRCWTEVEDALMSLARYDDESGAVSLGEVRAELGL